MLSGSFLKAGFDGISNYGEKHYQISKRTTHRHLRKGQEWVRNNTKEEFPEVLFRNQLFIQKGNWKMETNLELFKLAPFP